MSADIIQILEDIKADKPGAFDRFFTLVERRVLSFGLKVCGETEDAKDTLQETLLSAFKTLPHLNFNDPKALNVWLYKVAKNSCLMMRRKGMHEAGRELSLDQVDSDGNGKRLEIPDRSNLPDDALLRKEIAEIVRQATLTIPHQYRLPLVLRDMEQLSTKETAQILEISEENVKIRLHRARKYLRQALEKRIAGKIDSAELCRNGDHGSPCQGLFSTEEIARFKAAYDQAARSREI